MLKYTKGGVNMRLQIYEEFAKVYQVFSNYYDDYNIVFRGKTDDNNYLFIVEKFFFRTSNRATLTALLTKDDDYCKAVIVGSGGGQGMIFKFDWGASSSFENSILGILDSKNIKYKTI